MKRLNIFWAQFDSEKFQIKIGNLPREGGQMGYKRSFQKRLNQLLKKSKIFSLVKLPLLFTVWGWYFCKNTQCFQSHIYLSIFDTHFTLLIWWLQYHISWRNDHIKIYDTNGHFMKKLKFDETEISSLLLLTIQVVHDSG